MPTNLPLPEILMEQETIRKEVGKVTGEKELLEKEIAELSTRSMDNFRELSHLKLRVSALERTHDQLSRTTEEKQTRRMFFFHSVKINYDFLC